MENKMKWNYQDKDKWFGPFEEEELKSLFLKSTIDKNTLLTPENSTHSQTLSACFDWAYSDWVEKSPNPLRKIASRFMDGYVAYFFAKLLLSMGHFSSHFALSSAYAHYVIMTILLTVWIYLLLNSTLISITKVSIGKWFFGVAIVDKNYNCLKWKDSVARELMAIWKPLINLTNLARSNTLTKDTIINWDNGLGSKTLYRKTGVKQYALMAIGIIIMVLF